jgi:hypothetical protein
MIRIELREGGRGGGREGRTLALAGLHDSEHLVVGNGLDLGQGHAPLPCSLCPLLLDGVGQDLKEGRKGGREER